MIDRTQAHRVDPDAVRAVRGASGVNVVAGVWLIVAPFILGYSEVATALWNEIVIGAVILAVALIRIAQPRKTSNVSWVNAVVGVWLIAAPFVLGYWRLTYAMWNDILVGVLVTALAVWSALLVHAGRQYAT